MDKLQMLERIYEVIADKTLSFGSCITTDIYSDPLIITELFDVCGQIERHVLGDELPHGEDIYCRVKLYSGNFSIDHIVGIIGHPIMLGDVLDWMMSEGSMIRYDDMQCVNVLYLWEQKRKPIDDQSDECIKFVYGLLPKEN